MFESWKLKKEIKQDEVDWANVLKLLENGANPNIGYPSKVLEKAILEKKEDVVEFLLKKYPDLVKQNKGSFEGKLLSPLQSAFYSESPKMVQRLLEAGADVRQMNDSMAIIEWSCINDASFDLIIKGGLNLDKKDRYGYSYLGWAALRGKTELIQKLLENGASYDSQEGDYCQATPLKLACVGKHEETALFLIRYQNQRGALHADEADALETAIRKHMVPVVQKLIARIPKDQLDVVFGEIALKNSIEANGIEVIKQCESLNIHRTINGVSPLIYAIKNNKADVAEALFDMGSDVTLTDECGNTVLMWAVKNAMMRLTKKLLQTDIALDIENQQGYTAYDIALESGHPAFAELIKNESLRRQGITQVSSQPTSAQIVQQKNLQQIRER